MSALDSGISLVEFLWVKVLKTSTVLVAGSSVKCYKRREVQMRFSATLYTLRAHCYTFARVLRFCVSVFTLVKKNRSDKT